MCTPVDQLGLLILAHMYHHHFCVFLRNGVWTTRRNNSMDYCKIFFVYKGNSDLCHTVLTDIFNPVELALLAVPALHASKHSSPDHTFHERTPTPPPPTDDSNSGSSIQRGVDDDDVYENIFAPFNPNDGLLQEGVKDSLLLKTNSLLLLQIVVASNKKELRMKTNSLLLQLNDQGQHQKSLSITEEQKKF